MAKVNFPVAIFSLVISVLLWGNIYSGRINKPEQKTLTVGVFQNNLDQKKYALTDLPSDLSITLAGSREQIRALSQQTISGIVDLSAAEPGEKNYPVFLYPSNARDMLVNSNISVRVKVEPLVTKRFDIDVFSSLDSKKRVENVDVFPRTAFVTGPASVIESVSSVRAYAGAEPDVFSSEGIDLKARAYDVKNTQVQKVIMGLNDDHPEFTPDNATGELSVRVRFRTAVTPPPQTTTSGAPSMGVPK
jgi:YbbR domain-containing protein